MSADAHDDRMREAQWRQVLADIDQKRADYLLKQAQWPLEDKKFALERDRLLIQAAAAGAAATAAVAAIAAIVARLVP